MLKYWKLSLLAFTFIALFTALGCWQIARFHSKKELEKKYQERLSAPPLSKANLKSAKDLRFFRINLTGYFDHQHNLLLDNKIFKGKIGYELYTPFYIAADQPPILIDRGFIPIQGKRDQIPALSSSQHRVTINGMLNLPPRYFAMGKIMDQRNIVWPLRIEFINMQMLSSILATPLFPYILTLDAKDPAAYPLEWQTHVMPPERNLAYAVQWFALALTLLIIWVTLMIRYRA